MPTITRRQQAHSTPENVNNSNLDQSHMEERFETAGEEIEQLDGPEDDMQDEFEAEQALLPNGLKEISSLASWTVTTAKPGNGVAALRSPDMNLFWQSDGPQPHCLNIHFFKLVQIVLIRVFLDFESDESYTPTKIQFLAGMGAHDLQEFAEMEFEQPTGWIEVDFSNIGPIDDDDTTEEQEVDWSKRPVLRTMLVQVRILENHQNGKDTHLRGLQVFARDEPRQAKARVIPDVPASFPLRSGLGRSRQSRLPNNIKLASWMQEPDLR